jgi:hypothetical protein
MELYQKLSLQDENRIKMIQFRINQAASELWKYLSLVGQEA